jgi:NTE family protein
MNNLQCDLILEGGGVKGTGLAGAFSVLAKQNYQFRRIAGTSAGAIVGALIAAGITSDKMIKAMNDLDYTKFEDKNFLDYFGPVGEGASLIFKKGIYLGKYLHKWLDDQLRLLGVHTFGDLRLTEDWAKDMPKEQAYKLVVITSDISSGKLVRLPWDYAKYGLNPDEQPIADAVRASMSIPFFFRPVKLKGHYLVDGGALSNFPINIFDRTDGAAPRWPTFGVKLSARPENMNAPTNKVRGTISLAKALLGTMASAHDQMHLDDPAVLARTIFVDTASVQATDFHLKPKQRDLLFKNGQRSMQDFLQTWDFQRYSTQYRAKP